MNSHKRQFLALAAVLLANVEDDDIFLQAAKRHKKENAGKKEPAAASKQLLVTRLNAGPHDYMDLLCVSREQFLHLMSRVRMGIVKDKTVANRHVSAQTRLQVTLRYLTSGELPESLRDQFKLGRADVGALIQKTCNVIYKELKDDFMRAPKSEEDWKEVARLFNDKCSIPNCVGALGGRHVVIKAPAKSRAVYTNSKNTFSLILFAVVDANGKFIYTDVGAAGAQGGNEVWQMTDLQKAIYSNKAQLPEAIKVESSPDVLLPPVFIADDTLPLERHVMKPFIGSNLTQEKRGFNERLAMVQQVANDAFGAMESRFGCLRTVIQEKPERVAAIVNATCVLHNFLGNHVPSPPGASAKASSGTEVFFGFPSSCGNTSVDGCATRDVLTAFFKS
ncbi:putative nuclease HARBI1 [Rhipicephalus sanguineus]|uniref:putative nuclease HARBI1 n=1 Tax=Rhipicephalus sanguineus TaxID=34632 RepID=UPI001894E24A|nr:putative nuclease HARBI1 [Rhipicephalus sanguineus]